MKLSGKIVVITGAGSGIGRALVFELVRRGAKVAALDVNEKTLSETAMLSGAPRDQLATFVVNVADRKAVEASVQQVVARFGAVDGLINNAGIIQPFVRLHELDDATIERVFDVNWKGVLSMTRAYLPVLMKRPEAHLVNVSSMGGFCPVPGQTIYGASKAAVKLFTEGLYAELEGSPVHVTGIFPGAVATNIVANSGVTLRQMEGGQANKVLPADEAARQMLDGVERNAFRVLVGQDARVLDLLTRLNPRRATRFIAKQMKGLLPAL